MTGWIAGGADVRPTSGIDLGCRNEEQASVLRWRFWKVEIAGKTFEPLWLGAALVVPVAVVATALGLPPFLALIIALPVGLAGGIASYAVYVQLTAKVLPPNPSSEDLVGKARPLRRQHRGL